MNAKARWLLGAALVLSSGCEKEPPKPKRTEPWPAVFSASASATPIAAPVRYAITPESKVRFELPAREAKPRGVARLVRGEITLHLHELAQSAGTVEVDLGSISMTGEDGGVDRSADERALSWLGIGSSRPEAERERLRWAKFETKAVEDLLRSSAAQERRVPFTAVGELSLHGFRVPARAALELELERTAEGGVPEQIVIRTRRPFVVSLSTHDIKPRDSHGVFLAQETKLLGVRVGREALVSLELRAQKR